MDTFTVQKLLNSFSGILSSFNHTNLQYVSLLLYGITRTRDRWGARK